MFLESVARKVLLGLNLWLHPAKWWTYYYWTLFPQLMLRSCSWPCRFRSIGGRNKTVGPASLRRIVGSSAYYRCCVGKGSSAKTLLSAFKQVQLQRWSHSNFQPSSSLFIVSRPVSVVLNLTSKLTLCGWQYSLENSLGEMPNFHSVTGSTTTWRCFCEVL